MALRFFLLYLFFGISVVGNAQSILRITNEKDYYNIKQHLHVLLRPTGATDLSAILETSKSSFVPAAEISDFDTISYLWAYIDVQNDADKKQDWWFYVGNNDFVNFYLPQEQYYEKLQTGFLVKGSDKPITVGSYYLPVSIPNGTTKRYYFEITKDFHKVHLDFSLQHETYRVDNFWAKRVWSYFLQGILWIMFAYALAVFFRSGDRTYLFYGSYLISTAIFYWFADSLLREIIIPEFPHYTYLGVLPLFPAATFYFLFLRDFLDVQKGQKTLKLIISSIVRFNLIMIALFLLVFFLTTNRIYIQYFGQIVTVINGATGIVSLGLLLRHKHPLSKFFITGSLIFMLSVIVDGIAWDSNLIWSSITKIGLVIEVVFFSLGLGERMRLVEASKREAQEAFIDQLEKNKLATEKQNELLESMVEDRTAELQAKNDDLVKAKEVAELAAKAKTEFLSIMSHEIRTPMNGVIGMTHFLLNENPNPNQIENLKSLKFSAENLMSLLNDILDYSKIESGSIDLEEVEFNLNDMIRGIGYQFKPRAKSQGIKFNILLDQEVPSFLIGDPGRLSQILLNLISNAIKFTKEGYVQLSIHQLEQSKEEVKLEFAVEDTGIGIPKDKIGVIFDQFTQAATDTTRKFGGTGLGLAITKRLIERMDSDIKLESDLGKGSKFSFVLDMGVGKGEIEVVEEQDVEDKIRQVRGMHVLVVDDNRMNRIILEKFLKKWDITFDSVEDGPTAIEKVVETNYDMVLLDIQMPEMDGFQVTEIIRGMPDERFKTLAIVALSADIFANVYDKVLDVGMNDFVSKPFNPDELLNVLCRYNQQNIDTI